MNKKIFPEGTQIVFKGRGYSYVKKIREDGSLYDSIYYDIHSPNFRDYEDAYLELYGFEKGRFSKDRFFEKSSIHFFPNINYTVEGDDCFRNNYTFSRCETMDYFSPFSNLGKKEDTLYISELFYSFSGRFLTFYRDTPWEISSSLLNNTSSELPEYICKLKAGEGIEKFIIPEAYSSYGPDKVAYIGGLEGFKKKMTGGYKAPSLDAYRYLSPKSYVDFFNSLYDFTAAGETPTSEEGEIKLNPRAFKILKPEELAILTNKGWKITQ